MSRRISILCPVSKTLAAGLCKNSALSCFKILIDEVSNKCAFLKECTVGIFSNNTTNKFIILTKIMMTFV